MVSPDWLNGSRPREEQVSVGPQTKKVLQQRNRGAHDFSLCRREFPSGNSSLAAFTSLDTLGSAHESAARLTSVSSAYSRAPTTSQPSGKMFWDQITGQWTFVAHNLPRAAPNRTYQLWLITRAQRKISAGVFATSASGDAAQTRPDERRIGQLKETVSSCSRAIRFSPALSAPCPLSHLEPIARLPHG